MPMLVERDPRDAYRFLVEHDSSAWVTHHPAWLELVESLELNRQGLDGASAVEYLIHADDHEGPLAGLSFADDGYMVVVGRTDPSGLLFRDSLEPSTIYHAAFALARELGEVARERHRAGVLIKCSAVTRSDVRGLSSPVAFAFQDAGYSQVARQFFAVRGHAALVAVSSRTKTQIASASRIFMGREAVTSDELATVVDLYSAHSEAKGRHCPFTVDALVRLGRSGENLVRGYLYDRIDEVGMPLGFSITLGWEDAAEVFTWGSLDAAATAQHLTKFIVADSIRRLADAGHAVIEYGCRYDGHEYGGLTEFYRRIGGEQVPGVWMYLGLDGVEE